MGIRSRIKAKIQERLQDVRALVRVVNEEAKHPGRPQPHMVARNPLWGGEAGAPPTQKEVPSEPEQEVHTASPAVTPTSPPPSSSSTETKQTTEDDDFWYLRGDDEGWSDLNPGKS